MATLAHLLTDHRLALVPVVDERREDPVRWVATSELADPAPFLEGGEVLLTTGLETSAWKQEWSGYVRRLAGAGVVAIGLAVDLTYDRSPDALVRACRRHRVDLFEVPSETTFVAISRRFADLVQREQHSAERTALEAQRALVQAAIGDEDRSVLLAEVARIGVAAAIVTADGDLVGGPVGERPELVDVVEVAASVARMRPQGLRAASSLTTSDGVMLVHPLGVSRRPDRYLVTAFAGRSTEMQRSTVTTAVALLSLVEARHLGRREADRRLRARALELLVHGDNRTARVLLGVGSAPRPRLPRTGAILRVLGTPGKLADSLDLAERRGLLAGPPTRGDGSELIMLAASSEARRLAEQLAHTGVRVGIGQAAAPADLAGSNETARHALERTTAALPVVSWTDSVRDGVLSVLDADRAAAFAATYLAPLDEADDPALRETLAAYLRHHGSLLQVASDLGVHRNTVRNRVTRIEGLLRRSLADPQVRVDAWVALHSRRD